ncbi:MAG: hypothetical protein HXY18_19185 [Bryobacteraceae bacterium]|nr:hypothetical protein [Bryobacteraceae bacterium]
MKKVLSFVLLTAGASVMAMARVVVDAPEIDANSAASALALLSGALLVFRSRRRS